MAKAVLTLCCGVLAALALPASVFADSVSYTYDVFGRVVTATYSSGATVTYTYDAAGNRTAKNVSTGGSSALSASVSGTYYSLYRARAGTPSKGPAITCSGAGGTAPYSYSWEYQSGDTGFTADSPTSNSTQWSHPLGTIGEFYGYWRCKVTDATSAVAYSETITLDYLHDNGL